MGFEPWKTVSDQSDRSSDQRLGLPLASIQQLVHMVLLTLGPRIFSCSKKHLVLNLHSLLLSPYLVTRYIVTFRCRRPAQMSKRDVDVRLSPRHVFSRLNLLSMARCTGPASTPNHSLITFLSGSGLVRFEPFTDSQHTRSIPMPSRGSRNSRE
jgi:hypothetical protein